MSVADQNQRSLDSRNSALEFGQMGDFFALMKPRVMSLVIFTAVVGLVVANALNPGQISFFSGVAAILSIAIGAGAAGALNMWYDADIDRIMARTASRPVPAGKVSAQQAMIFGLVLSALSVLALGFAANWLASGLLAFTIFFYAVIYTIWLKRSTPQNIVIGGAAGSFPPMIAWASVTGSVTIESIVLFLIIFMWTPPHFWSLALLKSKEYEKAGVPMLPVVSGPSVTRNQIMLYTVLMVPVGIAPALLGFAGLAYGVMSSVLGGLFLALAIRVHRRTEGQPARKAAQQLFAFSIVYLFVLYATLLIEHLLGAALLPSLI